MKIMETTGKFRKNIVASVLILFFANVSLTASYKSRVVIAVAANLIPAMKEIELLFESDNSDIDLQIIPGSSGKIAAQIINGAPFDIFASADMDFPEKLKSMGLTSKGPDVYARGFLVLFTVKHINLDNGIYSLKGEQVKKISVANPDTAPYGKAAVNALIKSGLYKTVKKNLVYAGNVSQAAQYVITGADVGLVARSLMYDPMMKKYKENYNWVTIDDDISAPLKQGVVLLARAKDNANAVKIYKFILSKKSKAVFRKYGYR
jgi:molybdate transport system substrate-binding protein